MLTRHLHFVFFYLITGLKTLHLMKPPAFRPPRSLLIEDIQLFNQIRSAYSWPAPPADYHITDHRRRLLKHKNGLNNQLNRTIGQDELAEVIAPQ